MSDISIRLVDNSGEVLQALEENLEKTLENVGLQAAGYAQLELESEPARVDTGLLRNSITYAIAGEEPAIHSYQSNSVNKKGESIPIKHGEYHGKMAKATGEHSVYVGTNVSYSGYVHEGVTRANGTRMEANRFLRNAIDRHKEEYKRMIEQGLKGEL